MTNCPYLLPQARSGYRIGNGVVVDAMVNDGLWDAYENFHMGMTGELVAEKYGITREEQDKFAFESHQKAVRARVTFADDWDGCPEWNPCNVAEVATHEIGHSIGFDHSSEDPNESDPTLQEATMYFMTHFDGRCAGLRADDVAAVSFVYPNDKPPTIETASPLPIAVAGEPYRVEVSATGGAGSFQFERIEGPCTGFPGLELSSDGVIEGTPMAFGNQCYVVKATDANGDSHTKRLDLQVSLEPPTPTNTIRVETPTPTATFAPVEDCIGDCDGDGAVGVDELVRSVRVALGLADLGVCSEVDADGDGRVAIDELVAAVLSSLASCAPA